MQILKGNIWDYTDEKNIIVIPINKEIGSNGMLVMGKGVALDCKNRYPESPKILAQLINNKPEQATYYIEELNILGFATKHSWRDRKSDLLLIERGLMEMLELAKTTIWSNFTILPKLGCGLGGLDWGSEVEPLMAHYLTDPKYVVLI